MALQVNVGTVQVINGATTVRHEWKLLMTALSGGGSFAVDDAVTWPGGAGTVGAWDSITKTLLVARTGGAVPAIGHTITGPSGFATVSSIATTSPPRYNAKVTLPAVATFERHYGDYTVASLGSDFFELASPYLGASAHNIEYGLNTDFTSLGLGLIRAGDVGATAIVTRSMVRINTLLSRAVATLRLSSDFALTGGMDAAISWGIEEEDDGGFIASVPTTTMLIPSGIKRVMAGVNLTLTAALSTGSQVVTATLLKNSIALGRHSIVDPGIALSISRLVTVLPGDTLSVKIAATGSSLPSLLAGTETNFTVGVFEVL